MAPSGGSPPGRAAERRGRDRRAARDGADGRARERRLAFGRARLALSAARVGRPARGAAGAERARPARAACGRLGRSGRAAPVRARPVRRVPPRRARCAADAVAAGAVPRVRAAAAARPRVVGRAPCAVALLGARPRPRGLPSRRGRADAGGASRPGLGGAHRTGCAAVPRRAARPGARRGAREHLAARSVGAAARSVRWIRDRRSRGRCRPAGPPPAPAALGRSSGRDARGDPVRRRLRAGVPIRMAMAVVRAAAPAVAGATPRRPGRPARPPAGRGGARRRALVRAAPLALEHHLS